MGNTVKTARWATCGGLNPGVLTLTDERLTWTAYGAASPGLDVPLDSIVAINPGGGGSTEFRLSLHDGKTVQVGVTAWTRRSWKKAIEQAVQEARLRRGA